MLGASYVGHVTAGSRIVLPLIGTLHPLADRHRDLDGILTHIIYAIKIVFTLVNYETIGFRSKPHICIG
jgi:hypothetical protein